MSLRTRTPTALILLTFILLSIQFLPPPAFFLFLQIGILASLFEFYNLPRRRNVFPKKALGFLLSLIIGLSFFFEALSLELALFISLFLVAIYFVLTVNKLEKLPQFPASIALTFFGAFYLSFTINFFYILREEKGPFIVYFLLAVVTIGDTGAYLFGKLLGRHKLVPIASPKKTWEGSFAGIVFACLGAVAVQQTLIKDFVLWKAILFALIVHAVAQISDPLESLFKRAVGVKDSSNILPGHGGFLDRIDSLILATPFFYYLVKLFGTN